MLRRPVLFSPGNLLSVEGTPSVPKISRLLQFLMSVCCIYLLVLFRVLTDGSGEFSVFYYFNLFQHCPTVRTSTVR